MDTRAPGGSPSRCAAFPPLTARQKPGAYPVAGGHETVLEPVVGEEAQVAEMGHDP